MDDIFIPIIKSRTEKVLIDKLVVQSKCLVFENKSLLVVAIYPLKAAIKVSVGNSKVVQDRVNIRVHI